jgi:hypothetical protein
MALSYSDDHVEDLCIDRTNSFAPATEIHIQISFIPRYKTAEQYRWKAHLIPLQMP